MRNRDAPHIDFSSLLGAIESNPKALPSNVDMILERNGRFLVGEWKKDGEEISGGQRILLRNLSKVNNFTVLIIQGESKNGLIYIDKFWQITREHKLKHMGNSLDEFKEFYNAWYRWANS